MSTACWFRSHGWVVVSKDTVEQETRVFPNFERAQTFVKPAPIPPLSSPVEKGGLKFLSTLWGGI